VIALRTLQQTLAELGQPPYRARQVYQALTRGLATGFAEMTSLPQALREELAQRLRPLSLDAVETRLAARGEARKVLFRTHDGHPVEAVLMASPKRATVCVSTQVGCGVGCAFCSSGKLGLRRSLTAEEMVDQVLHFARELRATDRSGRTVVVGGGRGGSGVGEADAVGRRVTNVVFMGMGEPFHNYDETLRACRLLNDAQGFALAARAVSVSTVGVVPGIDRFAAEPLQLNLAVSLHAATDELRSRLVPLNRTYGLDALFAACERYVAATRRKLFFEYVVLKGVNDTAAQVQALRRRLAHKRLYHLNLIAYNETGGEFARPEARALAALALQLGRGGVACTVRRSPGGEIEAACGQLALRA
jgi:23S rRNA (adenine2503-C2)-methyltransferase